MDSRYAERRRRVLEAIRPGVLVVFSTPLAVRNHDVEHDFRQHSDLFYLTGFDEPESVLVLASEAERRYVLFVRPRNPELETWFGARAGCDGAVEEFGAAAAFSIEELEKKLPDWLEGHPRLFYDVGRFAQDDQRLFTALREARRRSRRGKSVPTQLIELGEAVHDLRRLKEPREVTQMQAAMSITAEAHLEVMRRTRPGMFEYELEAIISGVFRRRGAERPAYSPIVAAGANATVLHYHRNNQPVGESDLVLIDAGCELGYYATDVTRTYPANGKFTAPQRDLYELVLRAQQAGIEATRPGVTFEEVHQQALRVITEGLIDLHIVEGPVDDALAKERYKPFFMHRTGHYLGMDVHDVGSYHIDGKPRPLEPGVVLTVEPGLYVARDCAAAPEELRGIGIRIEDDLLITETGARVLSDAIPRSVADIERVCAR